MSPTTPQRGERIKQLFAAALELPADRRSLFLTEQCSDDPSLVAEVLELLSHHIEVGGDLGLAAETVSPSPTVPAAEPATTPLPAHIGPYCVLRLLGEGGMGLVYLAEREHPFHQ